MADSRIYLVTGTAKDAQPALIRATSQAGAIRHYVLGKASAEAATQDKLIEVISAGGKVQDATAEGE